MSFTLMTFVIEPPRDDCKYWAPWRLIKCSVELEFRASTALEDLYRSSLLSADAASALFLESLELFESFNWEARRIISGSILI
jgi:hypothetical protein